MAILIVAEQSGRLPTRVSKSRRQAASDLGLAHLRLQWNRKIGVKDSIASIAGEDVTWSEGRSRLAVAAMEHRDWNWLLLLDDDIVLLPKDSILAAALRFAASVREQSRIPFIRKLGVAASRLGHYSVKFFPQNFLRGTQRRALEALVAECERRSPWSGFIYSATCWGIRGITWEANLAGDSAYVAGGDLQTRLYSRAVVERVFPAPISGSEGSHWFIDFLLGAWSAKGVALLNSCQAVNTSHEPHQDARLSRFQDRDALLESMSHWLPESWAGWTGAKTNNVPLPIIEENRRRIRQRADAESRSFELDMALSPIPWNDVH